MQIWGQIRTRIYHPRLRLSRELTFQTPQPACVWRVSPVSRYVSNDGENFTFLNLCQRFEGWEDVRHGMLWVYNLNYFDYLGQPGMTAATGADWIDRFGESLSDRKIGLDPYPIALRGINWIKFICLHREALPKVRVARWNAWLAAQYELLERKLETHLLGNHLLEDAYSLCIGSIYFANGRLWQKAARLLQRELDEQVLPDGSHYEQSPMYHCILLDRLLDVYNFSTSNQRFGEEQKRLNAFLRQKSVLMLGHLDSICYADGSFPLFNDAALGIAPPPSAIRAYAAALGIQWSPRPLGACGYRHLRIARMESFVDVGGIMASYQAGHSHADALNFELRIDGEPFVVDTGISTYNKTPRRQYERSTAAHNTVTVDGHDSAEVWGGFRVARRSSVALLKDEANDVCARQSGIQPALWHERRFLMREDAFVIMDRIASGHVGVARLHLAPAVTVENQTSERVVTSQGQVLIKGAEEVKVSSDFVSTAYNVLKPSTVVEITFQEQLEVSITPMSNRYR